MCSDLVKRNTGYCDGVVWRGTRTEARIVARTSLQYLSQNMLSFCRWSRKESRMTSKFLVWSTGSSELPLCKTKSKERKDLGRTYQELGFAWDKKSNIWVQPCGLVVLLIRELGSVNDDELPEDRETSSHFLSIKNQGEFGPLNCEFASKH